MVQVNKETLRSIEPSAECRLCMGMNSQHYSRQIFAMNDSKEIGIFLIIGLSSIKVQSMVVLFSELFRVHMLDHSSK